MNSAQRKDFVNQQIEKLHSLLAEWEQYQLTVQNPNEALRSKSEIARIKQLLTQYETELLGGTTVDESGQAPLVGPAIRRNNRKWITGIILSLLLGGFLFFICNRPEIPDYNKYLSFLKQGDSLIKIDKYPEAKAAYKKAVSFNPGDSAVIQKITNLKKADELIKQNKFSEAKRIFQIVISIPASISLSPEALAMVKVGTNTRSDPAPLSVTMEWKDGVLYIKISGGTPDVENQNAPYEVEGLNCKNCIQWSSEGQNYTGKILREKINTSAIRIKDSKGKTSSEIIPHYNPVKVNEQPHVDRQLTNSGSDNNKEQQFNELIASGDRNFSANKFTLALQAYEAALTIKPSNQDISQKIDKCKENISRHIPLISISAGTFTMGTDAGNDADGPPHTVKLSPYAIGKSEVTVSQYKSYCNYAGKSMPPPPPWGWADDNPITNITWEEAKAYCEWTGGRLPTEAEWEYAARDEGKSNKLYSGGDEVDKVAVFKENSGNKPAHIRTKLPNAIGIYDMSGNVSEWCSDWFDDKYYANSETNNPEGPNSGSKKVIRGAAFNNVIDKLNGNQLRLTYRNNANPAKRSDHIGFRVVWEN